MSIQMSPAIAKRIAGMKPEELDRLILELERENAGGGSNVIPSRTGGTPTSAALKAVGLDALMPGEGGRPVQHARWEEQRPFYHGLSQERYEAAMMKDLSDAGYQFKGHWGSFGEWLKDGWLNAKHGDFVAKHKECFQNMDADWLKARGLVGTSGEAGGFLMLPELAPNIEALFIQNDIASRIDTMTISGRTWKCPRAKDLNRADGTRHGGIRHYWLDEGSTATESQPDFAFTKLEMKKLVVLVYMSNEIASENPSAVEQYVRQAVKEEISFAIARAIFWGLGGVEPVGFANSNAMITVAKESSQTTPSIITTNLLKMESRRLLRPGSQFAYYSHLSTIPEVGNLAIGNFPVNININNGGISQAPSQMLRGMPNVNSEFCKMLGESGDIFLADLKMYKAITRSLVREDVSMHVEFLTDKQCLRFVVSFDGAPLLPTPVTPYQAGATAVDTLSSFIQLATRP